MGFTRSYYVKRAISKLFHIKKIWYGSDPGSITRVMCSRNAGIFVLSYVSKLSFLPPPFFRPLFQLNSKTCLSFFLVSFPPLLG